MNDSFVSKVPPNVDRLEDGTPLSGDTKEILAFNMELVEKLAETVAMKVQPLKAILDRDTSLAKERDQVKRLIFEVVERAIQAGDDLGARISVECYDVEGAIGEYQAHDDEYKEVGPRELRLGIDISIPLDTVYLRLPPKPLRKAKRMWSQATAE